jgi:hypothetical protein
MMVCWEEKGGAKGLEEEEGVSWEGRMVVEEQLEREGPRREGRA